MAHPLSNAVSFRAPTDLAWPVDVECVAQFRHNNCATNDYFLAGVETRILAAGNDFDEVGFSIRECAAQQISAWRRRLRDRAFPSIPNTSRIPDSQIPETRLPNLYFPNAGQPLRPAPAGSPWSAPNRGLHAVATHRALASGHKLAAFHCAAHHEHHVSVTVVGAA